MKKNSITVILITMLLACENQEKIQLDKSDTVKIDNSSNTVTNTPKIEEPALDINKSILGMWKLKGEENASFKIELDKIYYPELSKYYTYKIISDSLKIKFDDYDAAFHLRMKGSDTLILIGDDGEQVYYKVTK
ncbi:MAG: hypothetical protein K2X37_11050 [Chitinophagaceae bacterium]|nr:hypothetical protein [Chitinophagaceae bacterium]